MSLNLKKLSYFEEKENFEGKKEKTLILNCNNCPDKNNPSSDYEICFKCFLKNYYAKTHNNVSSLFIKKFKITIYEQTLNKYLQYFKIINKLRKYWRKIESFKSKYCIYEDFNCKLYNKDAPLLSLRSNDFFNPVFIFNSIKEKYEKIKNINIIDPTCKRCAYKIKNVLSIILEDLITLDLIKEFKNELKEDKNSNNLNNIYKKLLGINEQEFNNDGKTPFIHNLQSKKLIKIYKIGDYGIFDVYIHEIPFEYEKRYSLRLSIERNTQDNYINKLLRDITSNIHILELEQTVSLEKLLQIYETKANAYINTKYNFNQLTTKKIAFLASLQKLNLLKIFPLLIDDYIEEVFLDSPIDRIYINHQKYGRCRTNINLSVEEIERIKTFLRLYSGKRLDYSNPSLKFVLKNKYFYCRFAVDIDPIHSNKFGLDIRKLNKNIYTIQDLLKKQSLNPLMAAFLYFCILRKINITVTGQTDTGKTTLINALDLIAPKEYRKVYVEDITESLSESEFGRHQIKFKVDSIESMIKKKFSKQNQIKNLLHRTPDIIYLGEILTKEEAEAMFHCLAAGLTGFQTIHSKDLNSLVNRFLYHFNINESCLNDLDLIIFMKKNREGRKIISISEISDYEPNSNDFHNTLFLFNPKTSKWDLKSDLFKTKTISQLKIVEDISFDCFNNYLSIYQDIFQFLLESKKLNNQELVALFDKINYLSFKSYTALNDYWQTWKKV